MVDPSAAGSGGLLLADVAVASGAPGAGQANGAYFELAHITLTLVGVPPYSTGGLAFSVLDGQVDIDGTFSPTVPGTGATWALVPEPASAGLVALALGVLGAAARRKRTAFAS